MNIKRPPILDILEEKGHKVFSSGDFDLNIIGIRSKTSKAGKFDDMICSAWLENEHWQFKSWQATTDPGVYWLKSKKGNKKGTAVLKAGQYRGAWILGKHRGRYPALLQRMGDVEVWRDANKDDVIDKKGKTEIGKFGINIHRAHSTRELETVGPYSAGCMVFRRAQDLDALLLLCRRQIENHPTWTRFSFTLIEE